jgi:hypothetical protein
MAQVKAPTRRGTKPRVDSAAAPPSPICTVTFCPVCAAVTAFGEARPDLLEHLLVAGREMLLAFRALIDARLDGSGETPSKLERLTIE